MKCIRIHEYGGPKVLKYEARRRPRPGPEEALIQIQAIGVNFIDVYHRTGAYPMKLPFTPGQEGAGVVLAVGKNIKEVREGDYVAYEGATGSYAESAVVPASRLVPLPIGIDPRTAAALLLQSMTAHYLSHSAFHLKSGQSVLIHAGAGGVGLLLIQMARRLGAHVFTTVSTDEKAALARKAGAHQVIMYTRENFEKVIRESTNGQGVNVVYDSVGKTTFDKSIKCLGTRGYMILYGQSSGAVPPISPSILRPKSLFLTRPSLAQYTHEREELLQRANAVFQWFLLGELKLRIHETFPLSEAGEAHRQLEGRKTTGKILLIP